MEIWSVGTALRNPQRIREFLNVLYEFSDSSWNEQTELDYYIKLIRENQVSPRNVDADELRRLPQNEARTLMFNNYEDAPIRGRVLGSLFLKLGLISLNDGRLNLTNRGNEVINRTISLENALISGLVEWQYIHITSQWNNIIEELPSTQNFSPFVATLYLIGRVNYSSNSRNGISYREFNYFAKTIDNYALVDIFVNYIISYRDNSNNVLDFINYVNQNFRNIQNADDYIDNDIRYFVESTLIESNYIENGLNSNFANLNYNQINQIRSIVSNNIPNCLEI